MATITLKNVPKFLHLEIKKRAERNRRSINNEIITALEKHFGLRQINAEEVISKIEELHKGIKGFLTQEILEDYKREGQK